MPTTNKRVSVSLTAEDESDLANAADQSQLICQLLDLRTIGPGEASVLRALMRLGLERLHEAQLARGYADLAASITEEDARQSRAMARRPRALERMARD